MVNWEDKALAFFPNGIAPRSFMKCVILLGMLPFLIAQIVTGEISDNRGRVSINRIRTPRYFWLCWAVELGLLIFILRAVR